MIIRNEEHINLDSWILERPLIDILHPNKEKIDIHAKVTESIIQNNLWKLNELRNLLHKDIISEVNSIPTHNIHDKNDLKIYS